MFNNIKITLHYSVDMRTSGEKVCISNETEHVQLVSYYHIIGVANMSIAIDQYIHTGAHLAWKKGVCRRRAAFDHKTTFSLKT